MLTPNAVLEPVRLAGTSVSRATLHNRDFIRQLDARVGDIVSVRKAGEIIPEIIGVEKDRRPLDSVPYEFPRSCPVCGAPVYDDEDEAAIRCTSASCPAQLLRNLMHFASRDAMDIDGCGEGNLQKLIDAGLVKSAADLYDLTVEQLLPLGKKVDTWANNLVRSIEASKTRDLSRLLFAFGIRHVGQKAGRILSDHFGSLDALLTAPVEEMTEIRDIGQTTAESIAAWRALPQSHTLIEKLRAHGVNFIGEKTAKSDLLAGKTIGRDRQSDAVHAQGDQRPHRVARRQGRRLGLEKDELRCRRRERRQQAAKGGGAGDSGADRGGIPADDYRKRAAVGCSVSDKRIQKILQINRRKQTWQFPEKKLSTSRLWHVWTRRAASLTVWRTTCRASSQW